jgi:hypothetical protein
MNLKNKIFMGYQGKDQRDKVAEWNVTTSCWARMGTFEKTTDFLA